MIKPISPREVIGKKKELMPDEVLLAFNEIIAKNFSNGSATVRQCDIVALLVEKLQMNPEYANETSAVLKGRIFNNHWLDVEGIYRKAGWIVSYDKPGFNESYEATFEFASK